MLMNVKLDSHTLKYPQACWEKLEEMPQLEPQEKYYHKVIHSLSQGILIECHGLVLKNGLLLLI